MSIMSRGLWGVLALAAWFLFCGAQSASVGNKSSCVSCHRNVSVETYGGHLFADWERSAHALSQVGCQDCHGGDATKAEKEVAHVGVYASSNPKSRVYFQNVPFTCGGRCHAKEHQSFTQSSHYEKLEAGGKGPNCVTCHGSMAIAVLGPEQMEEVCLNCHNPRLGISPAKAREARDIALLMEETRTLLEWALELVDRTRSAGGEVASAEKALNKAIQDYRTSQGRWHTFEMEALRKDLEAVFRQAKAAKQRLGPRPSPGRQPKPSSERRLQPEDGFGLKKRATVPTPETGQTECLECHRISTPRIAQEHEQSVHAQADLGCAMCHGGDAEAGDPPAAHSLQKGFLKTIAAHDVLTVCGGCHADIEQMRPYRLDTGLYREYLSSRHGQLLVQGDPRVATCTSCHGSHRILSHRNPDSPTFKRKIPETCGHCHADAERMQPYGIPTDQVAQYREGIHGRILSGEMAGKDPERVPTCPDCHGGHGAAPPDLKTVHAVCGTCHSDEQQYFRQGPHYESARRVGIPRCTDCHGNHRNTIPAGGLLVDGEKEGCAACHPEGEKGYQTALELKALLERAKAILADFEKTRALQPAGAPAAFFLEGEYARLQSGFSGLRKATHAVNLQEAQAKLVALEGAGKNALLYAEKVLSEEKESIGPLLLVLGGAATGVGLLSVAAAFLLLRRKGRGGERVGRT